ncbi:MAG TPA: alpha/beta hydrolase [Acidimicrobiia bacterium]|nr:alpha/beta hydrolase [Acidimicrobiia bacterium]
MAHWTHRVVGLLMRRRAGGHESTPFPRQRRELERTARLTPVRRNTFVEPVDAGGVPAEWVAAPGVGPRRTMLYLHGGGFTVGSPRSHRAFVSRLSSATRSRALSLEYRLAPEHPFPAAIEDAVAAYRWLLDVHASPERVVVAGDSAGGGLAISAMVAARDEGLPMPGALVVVSPWVDLTCSGASMQTHRDDDVWLDPDGATEVAGVYLGGADPADPLASPLFADHTGLPPTLIVVGTAEILLDDARRLADRMRAAGGTVVLDEWTDMLHVFPAFAPYVPESRRAIRQIGAFVDRRLPA